ncbi:SRPBCC domain-containing protein [Nocardioides guangzhouensis]|uniref:SRPBCC domain-containing protein n=1 Tax=Nocardioides guangzhouensis TaxID=2497878 RepID=A0A4Q4ZKR1_9ACTN|nr:SRPBCC domain-containing protein [Nocardioides guangzhouensis]RYP88024.1 SRPBCC domain-containing protein [Nocardioides guangzhouensis]
MKTQIRHEIEIDAPATAVWEVLTDTAGYPGWNPFIPRLTGELSEGARLSVVIAPPSGRAMTLRPTVLSVRPERELRWLGRLLVPGLFDGEHAFTLERLSGERTLMVQSERFRGVLVRPLHVATERAERGFALMNAALAAEVAARRTRTP